VLTLDGSTQATVDTVDFIDNDAFDALIHGVESLGQGFGVRVVDQNNLGRSKQGFGGFRFVVHLLEKVINGLVGVNTPIGEVLWEECSQCILPLEKDVLRYNDQCGTSGLRG
jgi:hypothetical protein